MLQPIHMSGLICLSCVTCHWHTSSNISYMHLLSLSTLTETLADFRSHIHSSSQMNHHGSIPRIQFLWPFCAMPSPETNNKASRYSLPNLGHAFRAFWRAPSTLSYVPTNAKTEQNKASGLDGCFLLRWHRDLLKRESTMRAQAETRRPKKGHQVNPMAKPIVLQTKIQNVGCSPPLTLK